MWHIACTAGGGVKDQCSWNFLCLILQEEFGSTEQIKGEETWEK